MRRPVIGRGAVMPRTGVQAATSMERRSALCSSYWSVYLVGSLRRRGTLHRYLAGACEEESFSGVPVNDTGQLAT